MEHFPKHPWIARLSVGIAILVLAFLGLVITEIRTTGGWHYWRWAVPIIALLALWLSWYLRRQKSSLSPVTIWHEVVHWAGLIASVFVLSIFVHIGIIGRFEAALCVLTLLAQAVFLAGIYIESTFLFIGVILGLFTVGVAFLEEYLYAIAIPILIAGAAGIIGLIWYTHKKRDKTLPPPE
jgi:hypothetical protein